MKLTDAANIVFGAALGLLISLLKDCVDSYKRKRRAEKLLKLELPTIRKVVEAVAGRKMVLNTELPRLVYLGSDDIASLTDAVAPHVYELDNALRNAEESRKIASGLLDHQDSPQFKMHVQVYSAYLNSAQKCITIICENIKCQQGAAPDD